jgi:hypothetical protein
MTSIWDQYPDLSPSELRNLVAATAQVLADGAADAELPEDPLEISTGEAARQLTASVAGLDDSERAVVQEMLEDDDASEQLVYAVLTEVRRHPELAAAVDATYAERARKMTGGELMLLAGALVVLATRIKEIKTGKGGTKITFAESGDAVKSFLAGLIATFRG